MLCVPVTYVYIYNNNKNIILNGVHDAGRVLVCGPRYSMIVIMPGGDERTLNYFRANSQIYSYYYYHYIVTVSLVDDCVTARLYIFYLHIIYIFIIVICSLVHTVYPRRRNEYIILPFRKLCFPPRLQNVVVHTVRSRRIVVVRGRSKLLYTFSERERERTPAHRIL